MSRIIFSITQVNNYVRSLMKRDPILNDVWIRGEISNLATPSYGHMYFTLKDERARIRCVMFRQDRDKIGFVPDNGMQIIAKGQVSIYSKSGQYQLYIYEMEPDGVGDLYAAFEALKTQLDEEGLFDSKYKKPIPVFPQKIAVITSHTGAAVKDIINIIKRRCKALSILVVPVLVQGESAADQISAALDYVNTRKDIDAIIVGRGGGSIEELWAFNEEKVARAIWRSDIPVVSAVGHETDNTIADFVADLRAPTPSAAAELIAPDMLFYRQLLARLTNKLYDSMQRLFKAKALELDMIKNSYTLRYPDRLISSYGIELDKLENKLLSHMEANIGRNRERFTNLSIHLDALSPLQILSRGYAIVTKEDNKIIYSVAQLDRQDLIDIKMQDGTVNCQIVDIDKMTKKDVEG